MEIASLRHMDIRMSDSEGFLSFEETSLLKMLDQHGVACKRVLLADIARKQPLAQLFTGGVKAHYLTVVEIADNRNSCERGTHHAVMKSNASPLWFAVSMAFNLDLKYPPFFIMSTRALMTAK